MTARMSPIQQSLGQRPVDPLSRRGVDGVSEGKESAEHPIDIPIHRRIGQVIGKGEDRPTGIGADPRQTTELLGRTRKLPTVVRDDDLGGSSEVAPPTVVA